MKSRDPRPRAGYKVCTRCTRLGRADANKLLTEFYHDYGRSDGWTTWCKRCTGEVRRETRHARRTRALVVVQPLQGGALVATTTEAHEVMVKPSRLAEYRRRQGLTDRLQREQRGLCKNCGNPEVMRDDLGRVIRLTLYGHLGGPLLMLLCYSCNAGLAAFRHSPRLMRRAADLVDIPLCGPRAGQRVPGALAGRRVTPYEGGILYQADITAPGGLGGHEESS